MLREQGQRLLLWRVAFISPFEATVGELVNIQPFVEWLAIHGHFNAIDGSRSRVDFGHR